MSRGFDIDDSEPDDEAQDGAKRVIYGQKGRKRTVKMWKCPLCDFTTSKSERWGGEKQAHIQAWHPESKQALRLRRLPTLRVPVTGEEIRWKCPCCELAITAAMGVTGDQSYAMRERHRLAEHPGEDKTRFHVLIHSDAWKSNTAKATVAVRSAAAARRVLQAKGTNTPHDFA